MTISDRDRKIALAIVPILLIVAYWFLLLAPKREEAATAQTELSKQQQRLTDAQGKVDAASGARTNFAADYTTIVRLGKAIPPKTDMPGLLVQLDRASQGTSVKFQKIGVGTAENPAIPPNTPPASGDGSAPPAAAGGEQAQSAPGSAAEKANNASDTSDQANQNVEQASGVEPGSTQTSTPAGGDTAAAGTAVPPAGLQTVPLNLEFRGNFFQLANFFHRVKRLVHTENEKVVVSGRLITIEGVHYTSDPEIFPELKAELTATIYLVPAAQGTAAGATPQGPDTTTPAASGDQGAAAPPAATATPR